MRHVRGYPTPPRTESAHYVPLAENYVALGTDARGFRLLLAVLAVLQFQ
jgi:hypothetical protein